jgi:hypothetical protein
MTNALHPHTVAVSADRPAAAPDGPLNVPIAAVAFASGMAAAGWRRRRIAFRSSLSYACRLAVGPITGRAFRSARYDPALGSPEDALLLASSVGHSDDYQRASEELFETPPGTGGTHDPDPRSDLVLFWLDGGGAVFSTGSIAWTGSLPSNDFDNNVARITTNVLQRFLDPEALG